MLLTDRLVGQFRERAIGYHAVWGDLLEAESPVGSTLEARKGASGAGYLPRGVQAALGKGEAAGQFRT